jgi:hypothetical protein
LLIWIRALELATRLARDESEVAVIAHWLVEAVRESGVTAVTVEALAAVAAARLGAGLHEQACGLLAELEQTPGASETTYYARQLAAMVRTALAADDPELAQRLADGLEPRYRLREHALCAARAQLAEAVGDRPKATKLYAEAAARWEEFGNMHERAHALLGQGRCLIALGDPAAEQPLLQAAELFEQMGYKPALTETEALLAEVSLPAT